MTFNLLGGLPSFSPSPVARAYAGSPDPQGFSAAKPADAEPVLDLNPLNHPSVKQAVWTVPTGMGAGAGIGAWLYHLFTKDGTIAKHLEKVLAEKHIDPAHFPSYFFNWQTPLSKLPNLFTKDWLHNPDYLLQRSKLGTVVTDPNAFHPPTWDEHMQLWLHEPSWVTGGLVGGLFTGVVGAIMAPLLEQRAHEARQRVYAAAAEERAREAAKKAEGSGGAS